MKRYRVTEIFLSVQGEGYWVGTPSVFLRFAGCNMWSGKEQDRPKAKSPICRYCDTDFSQKMVFTLPELETALQGYSVPHLVVTGGEPCLQVGEDGNFWDMVTRRFDLVEIETNGTIPCHIPEQARKKVWVTVSPKQPRITVDTQINAIKVVVPGLDVPPGEIVVEDGFGNQTRTRYIQHKFVQPLWDENKADIKKALEYVYQHTDWRISLQCHKYLNVR